MLHISLVEDSIRDRELLHRHLDQYAQTHELEFEIHTFPDGIEFLETYDGGSDIIFMDVEMPHLNGMNVAHRLRQIDPLVVLVFVTNMAQYAVQGYEVDAVDYLLKPIGYPAFESKFKRILTFVHHNESMSIVVPTEGSIVRLSVQEILYLEKDHNKIVYHTEKGQFQTRGTMAERASLLEPHGFSRCTAGILINLRYVSKIEKDLVWLGQIRLPLSRPQRKNFNNDFLAHLGGG